AWAEGKVLGAIAPPEAPQWLLDALERRAPCTGIDLATVSDHDPRQRFERVLEVMREAVEGERNNKLFWAACRCAEMERVGVLPESAWEE
ncbi:MAG: hypothetical protein N3D77_15950, partial [Geminicoccaceae bacterium]|nr:hypothetical protein [Geminicoccaceae bacterium]